MVPFVQMHLLSPFEYLPDHKIRMSSKNTPLKTDSRKLSSHHIREMLKLSLYPEFYNWVLLKIDSTELNMLG